MIVGITGGSGSGKSTIVKKLSEYGYFIIDADEIARYVVNPGKSALCEIEKCFGSEMILKDGTLNRKKLGQKVFADSSLLEILNGITHKYIYEEIKKRIEEHKGENIIIDAPVLTAGGLDKLCDVKICIDAQTQIRVNRIMKRDFLEKCDAENRISSQMSSEEYKGICDFCFDNSNEEDVLKIACAIKNIIDNKTV